MSAVRLPSADASVNGHCRTRHSPTAGKEPDPTDELETKLMYATDPDPTPMPTTEPKTATQSDQVCVPTADFYTRAGGK